RFLPLDLSQSSAAVYGLYAGAQNGAANYAFNQFAAVQPSAFFNYKDLQDVSTEKAPRLFNGITELPKADCRPEVESVVKAVSSDASSGALMPKNGVVKVNKTDYSAQ
ncbi:hypothetical protein AAVH_40205, partial [Aphelenchoides avenae]